MRKKSDTIFLPTSSASYLGGGVVDELLKTLSPILLPGILYSSDDWGEGGGGVNAFYGLFSS